MLTLLLPVVADRFGDLPVRHGDRQIDARIFLFLELTADGVLITGRLVVVRQNRSSFTDGKLIDG